MNIYRHAAVSFAVSAMLMVAFRRVQMSIACFVTGTLIDLDHVLDYYMGHELMEKFRYLSHPRRLLRFLAVDYGKHNPAYKPYKLLHSLELLILVPVFHAVGAWNALATGAVIGFMIHVSMDALPFGHIGLISLVYRIKNGFPQGGEVLKQRLSRAGRAIDRCQICGARGETVVHRDCLWYIGFTKRGLDKLTVMCSDCHDRMHDEGE
jgi:hypothetical protein